MGQPEAELIQLGKIEVPMVRCQSVQPKIETLGKARRSLSRRSPRRRSLRRSLSPSSHLCSVNEEVNHEPSSRHRLL